MTMANRPVPVPPTPEHETEVVELASSDVKTLLSLLRAQLLMDPPKLLALIETANPSDCDTTPEFFTFELSPGQTLVIDEVAPPNMVGVNTGGVITCDTPGAINATLAFDGKRRISVVNSPAMAGTYSFPLYGYNEAAVIEYTITNNHVGTVRISILGQGAFLSSTVWKSIKAQLAQLRKELITS